jgi:hypothetical protein
MILNQRDVVEVYFPWPDGQNTPHPVIVLSVPRVLNCEQTFIGVPISHSLDHEDEVFSFPLNSSMFTGRLKHDPSWVRMHLLTFLLKGDIVSARKVNEMKEAPFNNLFWQIQELVFGVEE